MRNGRLKAIGIRWGIVLAVLKTSFQALIGTHAS